jgi:hypothetical protein
MLFLLTSCTILRVQGNSPKPAAIGALKGDYELVAHFEKDVQVAFDWTMSPDVTAVLNEQLQMTDADAVMNMVIKMKSTPVDFFYNLFTLGLARSYTISVEGDLIKYAKS